jgi:hypothetical protein
MKKKLILLAVFLFTIVSSAQEKHLSNISLSLISQVNQGNSYITFPTDIGNIEPLLFEANVVPNFMIRTNKKSRLLTVLTPQIILRMYNEYSKPVKTPSYMPQLTMYYLIGNREQEELLTIFGRLAHHSNGQKDPLILADGSINLESGDFATNYFEFGGIITAFSKSTHAVKFLKSAIEYHPENSVHRLLGGKFSRLRWNNEFSAFKLPMAANIDKAKMSLDVKTTWLFGDMAGTSAITLDRLQASVTYSYFPTFLEEIGFFVQLYQGKDFYNVYFNENRTMIRFGLMTDKLRF